MSKHIKKRRLTSAVVLLFILSVISFAAVTGCDKGNAPKPNEPAVSSSEAPDTADVYTPPTSGEVMDMIANGETQYDGDYAVPIHLQTPADELSFPTGYSWQSLDQSICSVSGSDIIIGNTLGDTNLWTVDDEHTVHHISVRVRKAAYLTIDDWPSMSTTQSILDTLKEKNVKATFFLNYIGGEEGTFYKKIYNDGHVIANHTIHHWSKKMFASSDFMLKQYEDMNDFFESELGLRTNIIRIPGGSRSNTLKSLGAKKRNEFIKVLHENEYTTGRCVPMTK